MTITLSGRVAGVAEGGPGGEVVVGDVAASSSGRQRAGRGWSRRTGGGGSIVLARASGWTFRLGGGLVGVNRSGAGATLAGMTMDEITEFIESLGGVLTLRPGPGDGTPEIAWGDRFFYYSPTGVVPAGQPFATVVTKDYPDEPAAGLDRSGAFRVNIAAGKDVFRARTGRDPRDPAPTPADPAVPDVIAAHPTYGALGWLAVVDPGPATRSDVLALLRGAHDAARARYERRHPG